MADTEILMQQSKLLPKQANQYLPTLSSGVPESHAKMLDAQSFPTLK